ncbi:TPA: hemagglutinin repeat-containing protein [Yersinia enterocolitica]|nr:hemagglutinin repeat-containing protein [Yersinia enterocolitica]
MSPAYRLPISALGSVRGARRYSCSSLRGGCRAGKDTSLTANRDVILQSTQESQTLDGSNKSSGGSLGIGIGAGQGGWGINISASLNKGKGSESGNGVTHTETTINAGNQLNITSGRDAVLQGAQVSGETVKVDVGRDLLLQSQQDSDRYDSKQQDASVGGSFNFGSMTGSASINASRDKMHSNFDSVQEQTGIFAGSGGFDITVGEHTQLDGAVIGSTATADKNTLDTGTLGFSDIGNKADFKVEHQSVGISTGGSIGGQFAGNMANGLLVGANNEGHADSTTHAAVSDGTITVRDTDKQQQNVDNLSRDVEHANNALSPIFDKEKEQNRLREAQLIGEIGSQVSDVIRTQGQIIATKAANEKMQDVSEADRDAAKASWQKANPGKNPTAEEIDGQVYKTAYDKAFNESGYGTGGKFQQAAQAATAAIQGLAGGDMSKALAGASAPYLAEVIHNMTTDPVTGKVNTEANLMAHAVLGAVVAQVNGNSALAGASGAAMGEYIAQQMYPGINREDLTEEQRQTISALGTLAAGLAGGVVGNSTADAVAGAQAGKNAVENNYLSSTEKSRQTYLNNKQNLTPEEQKDKEALNRKDLESDLAAYAACSGKGGDCQVERAKAKDAQDTYFNQTYQNPKEAQAGYQQIMNLLNSTDLNAKEVFNILEGYTQAFMSFGYTEDEAKARAGAYVGSMYIAGGVSAVVASGALTKQFGKDVASGTKLGNSTAKPTVTAELEINGQKFKDTNQTARPVDQANKNEATLIADRVASKEQNLIDKGKAGNLPLPNSNMANAHAEIGVIQQAYNAGKTQDANLTINVVGKDVCSYCKGDIAAAAQASGAKSVTVNAIDNKTGLPKSYIWEPGMKSIKEIKKQ